MDLTNIRNRKRLAAALVEQRYKHLNNTHRIYPSEHANLSNNNNPSLLADSDLRTAYRPLKQSPNCQHPDKKSSTSKRKQTPSERGNVILEDPVNEDHESSTNEVDRVSRLGGSIEDDAIISEVKRRLSLPFDTSIPNCFLEKHKDRLRNELNRSDDGPNGPLSRTERRRSLYEIGFGQSSTYVKSNVLGAGTYSTVYKGVSRLSKKLVALKEIHLEREEGVPFTAIREVSLLKELRHNNIITLHDIIYTSKTLTLVFEYVDRDLSHYMHECDHLINIDNVKLFLYQLLRGLRYCHDRRVLHRDLKPQNILISNAGELKLADFGLARAKSVPTKTFTDEVVTLWYRPPDVLLGNTEYGTSIDMWGVGCIFFEMAAGFTLFTGIDLKKQLECIFEIIGTPSEAEWPTIRSDLRHYFQDIPQYSGRGLASMAPRLDSAGVALLSDFLKCNPRLRISSKDAIYHSYFNSLPEAIHELPDSESIFSLEGVNLSPELSHNPLRGIKS